MKSPRNDREAHAAMFAALDTRIEPTHLPHCGNQPNDAALWRSPHRQLAFPAPAKPVPHAVRNSEKRRDWLAAALLAMVVGIAGAVVLSSWPLESDPNAIATMGVAP
jgi:ferric-dicitrate binding protein FerR (iron transport regulator)